MAKLKRKTAKPRKISSKKSQATPQKSASVAVSTSLDGRTIYFEALSLYERGIDSLQRRNFSAAIDAFRKVLDNYPEERELHDRTRLYLKICERETTYVTSTPQTLAERIYAATLALNTGAYEDALNHLKTANEEDSNDDHVHYVLAVTYILLGDQQLGLTHLARAVELNPENRVTALQEPDFQLIQEEEAFRQAIETKPKRAPKRRPRKLSAE